MRASPAICTWFRLAHFAFISLSKTGSRLFSSRADQHLLVGETIEIPVRGGTLTIEDGHILRAAKKGKQYRIEALAPGTSTYSIAGQTESVTVQSAVFQKTSNVLGALVRKSLSFRMGQKNGQVEVTGKLVRFRDWERLAEGCSRLNCRYLAAFEIPAEIFPQTKLHIADEFLHRGYGSVELLWTNPLQIQVTETSTNLVAMAARFGLTVHSEKSALQLMPSVKVQLVIA